MRADCITYKFVPSPIGDFIAGAVNDACCLFEFHDRGNFERINRRMTRRYGMELMPGNHPLLDEVEKQVSEYFAGMRRVFELPIEQHGTPFEQSVWGELMKIPFGETRSYGELASKLGNPGASRAVGRANGANYIAVIIPCHRVLDSSGNLHGYGGGLWRKRWLLEHEGAIPKQMFD